MCPLYVGKIRNCQDLKVQPTVIKKADLFRFEPLGMDDLIHNEGVVFALNSGNVGGLNGNVSSNVMQITSKG